MPRRPMQSWRAASAGRDRRAPRWSRIELLRRPAFAGAAIDQPVMQAERLVLPELDVVRDQAEARPMRRPRYRADRVFGGEGCDPLLQLEPAFQPARLLRGPGADLARFMAAGEIGIGLGI